MLNKKDYDNLIKELGKDISITFPDICFYIYGSYAEDRADYGRSDIDGGLILNDDCVTDKNKVLSLSILFKEYLKRGIRFDFNLTDQGINKDGRFLSYNTSYTDYAKEKGIIISGPNYIKDMNGLDYKLGELHTSAFNFRFIRNTALNYRYNQKYEKRKLKEDVEKAISKLVGLPKRLLILQGHNVIPVKEEALDELILVLGKNKGLSIINYMNQLTKSPKKLDLFIEGCDFNDYSVILGAYERLLKAYITKFPEHSKIELRRD